MKKENRTSFLIILAVLMCSVLGGCSRITDNTDTDAPTVVGDQPHAEDYEQGYDLPEPLPFALRRENKSWCRLLEYPVLMRHKFQRLRRRLGL